MDTILKWVASRAANKLVGELAVLLLGHGLIRKDAVAGWESQTTEIVAASFVAIASWCWSLWIHRKHADDTAAKIDEAAMSGVGATVTNYNAMPPGCANLGVGIANTDVTKGN
jgi:hypothetical protein